MVEGFLVKRGLQKLHRDYVGLQMGMTINLNPWPWPYSSSVVFSFDCEGKYGGWKNDDGELDFVPKFAKLLSNNDVVGTFNFVGKFAEEHDDLVRKTFELKQDIAGHGYTHCLLDGMEIKKQREEIEKTSRILEKIIGESVIGWRSPYLTYDNTTYDILTALGFKWVSNWSCSLFGELPFFPIIEGKRYNIIEIPVDEIHYDLRMFKYEFELNPMDVKLLWLNRIKMVKKKRTLVVFLYHPGNMTEDYERFEATNQLIRECIKINGIWVTTCERIFEQWLKINSVQLDIINIARGKTSIDIALEVRNSNTCMINNLSLLLDNVPYKSNITNIEKNNIIVNNCDMSNSKQLLLRIPKIEAQSQYLIEFSIEGKEVGF